MTICSHELRSANSCKILAIFAGMAATGEASADMIDPGYLSPVFTSDNVLGWVDGAFQKSTFHFDLKHGSFLANARTTGTQLRISMTGRYMNPSTFALATNLVGRGFANGLQLFTYGQDFGDAAGHGTVGVAGILEGAFGLKPPGQMGVDPERKAYFLFQFQGLGTEYNGWIDVNIRVSHDTPDRSSIQNYIRINQYGWQSSTAGRLGAGMTPVPEPSGLVICGTAVLTGGAIALRRWRKERNAESATA